MSIIKYSDLELIRKENIDKKIVYTGGTFDLTHAGHILFLEDCKKKGDILIVLVANDSFIKEYKGKERPILNEQIRLKTIDSFKPVDFTILDETKKFIEEGGHLTTLRDIFLRLRPNFYVINDDAKDLKGRQEVCNNFNIGLVISKRRCPPEFNQIATSKIIKKILDIKEKER
jgi:cytidyltransferase-like protein